MSGFLLRQCSLCDPQYKMTYHFTSLQHQCTPCLKKLHPLGAVGSIYLILLKIYSGVTVHSGVTVPKIIEISWHSTKLLQKKTSRVQFLRHSEQKWYSALPFLPSRTRHNWNYDWTRMSTDTSWLTRDIFVFSRKQKLWIHKCILILSTKVLYFLTYIYRTTLWSCNWLNGKTILWRDRYGQMPIISALLGHSAQIIFG